MVLPFEVQFPYTFQVIEKVPNPHMQNKHSRPPALQIPPQGGEGYMPEVHGERHPDSGEMRHRSDSQGRHDPSQAPPPEMYHPGMVDIRDPYRRGPSPIMVTTGPPSPKDGKYFTV